MQNAPSETVLSESRENFQRATEGIHFRVSFEIELLTIALCVCVLLQLWVGMPVEENIREDELIRAKFAQETNRFDGKVKILIVAILFDLGRFEWIGTQRMQYK